MEGDNVRLQSAPARSDRLGDWGLVTTPGLRAYDRYRSDKPTRGERWRRMLGYERAPLPSYIGLIEQPPGPDEPPRSGICCSGGGIRSAAFNLGALQALQLPEHRRLQNATYLSAVSGGSYIAAAFAMVGKTSDRPGEPNDDSDPQLVTDEHPPFYHGSPEEQYLRNRSSYMAPAGVGKLRLVLRVAIGLLINLALLSVVLVVVAYALGLYYREVHKGLAIPAGHVTAGTTRGEIFAVEAFAGLAVLLGLGAVLLGSKADRTRQALETLALYALVGAALVASIGIGLPELLAWLRNLNVVHDSGQVAHPGDAGRRLATAAGGSFGVLLTGILLELRSHLRVEDVKQEISRLQKLGKPVRHALTRVAAWLLGPLLLGAVLALALLAFVSARHVNGLWPGLALVGSLAFVRFGDVTAWSLHPFYRRRLCTAFALKRVARWEGDTFGMAVERDFSKLVVLSKSGVSPGADGAQKLMPTLIVCAAANISDPAATPPGRGVTSFTFSPTTIGGPLVGGIKTKGFEKRVAPRRKRDFTLAAAVAMSGAAVSPSMGKDTRRSLRFLLALANVRLGVWVPNPRRGQSWLEGSGGVRGLAAKVHPHSGGLVEDSASGESADATSDAKPEYRKAMFPPRPGPQYLLKEMLGLSSVNDRFLYVTDGGHYENLGLVELLRRGCTEVFCFDASGGTTLASLGDAIALARSELSVEIDELDTSPLKESREGLAEACCVRGRITYPDGQTGTLIYVRTVVTAGAPFDVQAFRVNDPAFPHNSTLDQLYTDQKFEAYRELGFHAAKAGMALADEPATADAARAGAQPAADGHPIEAENGPARADGSRAAGRVAAGGPATQEPWPWSSRSVRLTQTLPLIVGGMLDWRQGRRDRR